MWTASLKGFLKEVHWPWALWSLVAFILLSEILLASLQGQIWRGLGRLELVDRPLLEDHAASFEAQSGTRALLLGDSVMYGSALREHGLPQWRQASLGACLNRALAAKGQASTELSADGLFPRDLEALYRRYAGPGKAPILLELNYRMFSREAGLSPTAFSRPWLDPKLADSSEDKLARFSHLFRYSRLANQLLWQPSRVQVLEKLMEEGFPNPQASDPDMQDALLNMKIQPYYQSPLMDKHHEAYQALLELAASLKAAGGPSLVFLCPQNEERIAQVWDPKAYEGNRKLVAKLFESQGLNYWDASSWRPAKGNFLDHCHLDALGNEALCRALLEHLAI